MIFTGLGKAKYNAQPDCTSFSQLPKINDVLLRTLQLLIRDSTNKRKLNQDRMKLTGSSLYRSLPGPHLRL